MYIQTTRPLKSLAEQHGPARQTAESDVAELYLHAAEIRAEFGKQVREVSEAVAGGEFEIAPQKNISRILEKILFAFENEGGSCRKIFDIVRAMITVSSMAQVAKSECTLPLARITLRTTSDRYDLLCLAHSQLLPEE